MNIDQTINGLCTEKVVWKTFKLLEIQPQSHFPLSEVVNIDQTINALL